MKRMTMNSSQTSTIAISHQPAGSKAIPGVETLGHVEATEASQRHRDPDLGGEAALDRLEQGKTVGGFGHGRHSGQNDRRHERDAAEPVDHRENMDCPRKCDVVHRGQA